MKHKFENVELIGTLKRLMLHNAQFSQNDLQNMTEALMKINSTKMQYFLWFSHPLATYCLPEKMLYLMDTRAYQLVQDCAADHDADKTLAFAGQIHEERGYLLYGTLYEVNFQEYAEYARKNAFPISSVEVTRSDGTIETYTFEDWRHIPSQAYSDAVNVRLCMGKSGLPVFLQREHQKLEALPLDDMELFIHKISSHAKTHPSTQPQR